MLQNECACIRTKSIVYTAFLHTEFFKDHDPDSFCDTNDTHIKIEKHTNDTDVKIEKRTVVFRSLLWFTIN